jgi:uncharacterized protein (TIGR02391 family)
MSSSAISSVIYGVTGRKIAVSHVIQYLQPFQEAGIIRREKTEGKILWFGSWETPSSGSGNVLFDQLIRHRRIRKTSSELFMDGHYASAIFEACKTLEVMVKEKAREGLDSRGKRRLVGQALMAEVFNEDGPILRVNKGVRDEDYDEQAGFRFLFMGMMRGVRDPKGHSEIQQRDSFRALQYLVVADLLARRIDEASLVTPG